MAAARPSPPRDRVLRVAGELFYEHGFHAVGIDLIIERAGVAKATLYRHFPTKDDLIAAYLDDANQRFWSWLDGAIDPELPPADTLARLFDAVATLATSPVCLGCTFQVTAAEFPDPSHPGHTVALAHKHAVRERLSSSPWPPTRSDQTISPTGCCCSWTARSRRPACTDPTTPVASVATAARALIAANTPGRHPAARR